jgi:hypothetical protein
VQLPNHLRCFYAKHEPNVDQLESEYLKSALLIQVHLLSVTFSVHALYLMFLWVYKAIFTPPSSTKDLLENEDDYLGPHVSLRPGMVQSELEH